MGPDRAVALKNEKKRTGNAGGVGNGGGGAPRQGTAPKDILVEKVTWERRAGRVTQRDDTRPQKRKPSRKGGPRCTKREKEKEKEREGGELKTEKKKVSGLWRSA